MLAFVRNRAELTQHRKIVVEHASQDRLTWVAYPKAGQLDTDLNRDVLWELLEGTGIRPVRQVALDDTWSAMRFRPRRQTGILPAGPDQVRDPKAERSSLDQPKAAPHLVREG